MGSLAVRAGVVPAHPLPTGETRGPATVFALVKITPVTTLGTLTASHTDGQVDQDDDRQTRPHEDQESYEMFERLHNVLL
jgi:hypothetical protein